MKELVSPQGHEITGIVQTVRAVAHITLKIDDLDENGSVKQDLDFAGESEVSWDDQEDRLDEDTGERLFEDDDGNTFPESQIHFIDHEAGITTPQLLRPATAN